MSVWSLMFMQEFSVESKTSKPGTSQAMKWTWLQEAQGPTREDEKLWGPEQKMLNFAGQGASSKPRRNWRQGPTCRRENTLEDSRSIVHEGGHEWAEMGPRRSAHPISRPIRAPFDLVAIQTIYSPPAESHASTHSLFTVEEQRRERHHSREERVELVV
jgi:hypothetical protein